jgi:hypothetical protein
MMTEKKTAIPVPVGIDLAPAGVPLPEADIHRLEGEPGYAVLTSCRKILLAIDLNTDDSEVAWKWINEWGREGGTLTHSSSSRFQQNLDGFLTSCQTDHIFIYCVLPPSLYDPVSSQSHNPSECR